MNEQEWENTTKSSLESAIIEKASELNAKANQITKKLPFFHKRRNIIYDQDDFTVTHYELEKLVKP